MTISLNAGQLAAADTFMSFMVNDQERFMVLRGHSGSGKSTLTKHLLQTVHSQMKMLNMILSKSHSVNFPIHVTAPTNQAAKVVADMAGTTPKTIQSLLGLKPIPDQKGGMKLVKGKKAENICNALVIIDEASYIGAFLLKCIHDMCINCKVLFIGDPYQLAPPKEHHLPVFDLAVPTASLETVMRNPGPIAMLGAQFRDCVHEFTQIPLTNNPILNAQARASVQFPRIVPNGSEILHLSQRDFQSEIDAEFRNQPSNDNHAKILAWTNDMVIGYNDYIRELQGRQPTLQIGERVATNKPVLDTKSRIILSTDDIATITDIGSRETCNGVDGTWIELGNSGTFSFSADNHSDVTRLLRRLAEEKNWTEFYYIKANWLDVRPIHSSTTHKSQGSTYDRVFVDLTDIGKCNMPEDVARMLYVGPTRAVNQVVFCGDLPRKYRGY